MIEIKIKGRKIERFLKKLNQNNINIYKINKDIITVSEKDMEKIEQLKTIYEIEIIKKVGLVNQIKSINKIFILGIILGILTVKILSSIIFEVKVITEDYEIKNMITNELSKEGISKHHFKKSEKELNKITRQILKKHQNDLEWLYIEEVGTKYNVKVQIRKIKKAKEEVKPQHIIAKKNAVIRRIIAKSGEIIKIEGQYVKKGEIIVTGDIKLYENTKNITPSVGKVYGEVWYKVRIEQPYILYGNIKKEPKINISFRFINKIFGKYNKEDEKILTPSFMPIGLQITKTKKNYDVNTILTVDEAKEMAKKNSRKKIISKLNDKEYIITEKQLKQDLNDSKIVLEMFYSIYEDITEYQTIE